MWNNLVAVPLMLFCMQVAAATSAAVDNNAVPAGGATPRPIAELFAPEVISGPGSDGSPSFTPDGNTLFFTRSAAHWSVILESHRVKNRWSKPRVATFSGMWPDSSPAVAPDGSFIVFQSSRPIADAPPGSKAQAVSNLWRVERTATGWSAPQRLPDTVNIGPSVWKPSVAEDHSIYLTLIDDRGKRLYRSAFQDGHYQLAEPLSFSDGTTGDVDPAIAPDESFVVFSSSGRVTGDDKDHLFMSIKHGKEWGPVFQLRYADDDQPYGSNTDDDPSLGTDRLTLYFSSDRTMPVHFPRTREQALQDLERLDQWDNGNTNVWTMSLTDWLTQHAT